MDLIRDAMKMPVDNFLGMLIYGVLFMAVTGIIVSLALKFIPNRLPYAIKSFIVFIFILFSLYLWWKLIVEPGWN